MIRIELSIKGKNKTVRKKISILVVIAFVISTSLLSGCSLGKPLTQNVKQIEAGSNIDPLQLVALSDEAINKYTYEVTESDLNVNVPGSYNINYTVTYIENNKQAEYFYHFEVIDTTGPEITANDSINITVGDEFNLSNYVQVNDIVDGVIDISNVSVEGNVDTNTVGSYPITLSVSDSTNNVSTKAVTVVVDQQGNSNEFFEKIISDWVSVDTVNPRRVGSLCDHYLLQLYIENSQFKIFYFSIEINDSNEICNGLSDGGRGVLTFTEINASNTYAVANCSFIGDSQGVDYITEYRTVIIDLGTPKDNLISVDLGDGNGMHEYRYLSK